MERDLFLIIGLGNPGLTYEETRHNIGFRVVRAFAEKHGFTWRRAAQFLGAMAEGSCDAKKVIGLLPMTFMNRSGDGIKLCADYFHIPLNQILVICDDVALPFGKQRLREKGSAGGHNGLKSVEERLGSQEYPRLRIGVGEPVREELADYVLGKFSAEERLEIPSLIEKAVATVETWISLGITKAMQTN